MLHKDSEKFSNVLQSIVEQHSYTDLRGTLYTNTGFTVNDAALSVFKTISESHQTPLLEVLAASRAGLRVLMLDEFLDVVADLNLCEGASEKLARVMSELPENLEILTHFEAIAIDESQRKWITQTFGQDLPENTDIAYVATCWGKHEGQPETHAKPDIPPQVLLAYRAEDVD